jgi:hypothetical protein
MCCEFEYGKFFSSLCLFVKGHLVDNECCRIGERLDILGDGIDLKRRLNCSQILAI